MEELSEEQIEEFREAFSLFDTEGEGKIFTKELGTVLRTLGIHTTEAERNEYFNKFDSSCEGIIYFKDFLEILVSQMQVMKPEEELLEAFKIFDTDKRNYMDIEHFRHELQTHCPGIDHIEIEEICEFLRNTGENGPSDIIKLDDAVAKIMENLQHHLN